MYSNKKDLIIFDETDVVLASVDETMEYAERFAAGLEAGAFIALIGELGSGKTAFVNGMARALGINEPMTSPTFTLINEYAAAVPFVHCDLYRLNNCDEVFELDIERYFSYAIVAVEWADRCLDIFPDTTHVINIEIRDERHRVLRHGRIHRNG